MCNEGGWDQPPFFLHLRSCRLRKPSFPQRFTIDGIGDREAQSEFLVCELSARPSFFSNMLVYLCGAIEYSPDHGKAWRAEITPFLRALGHDVYDPALDEKKNLTNEERRDFRKWKSVDLPRFQGTLRKIIDWDLEWIEKKCDYIVAYWDQYAGKGAGSQGELTVAYRRGMPVYLVSAIPVEQVSGWILGCATEVFASFDELKTYLNARYATKREAACAGK